MAGISRAFATVTVNLLQFRIVVSLESGVIIASRLIVAITSGSYAYLVNQFKSGIDFTTFRSVIDREPKMVGQFEFQYFQPKSKQTVSHRQIIRG